MSKNKAFFNMRFSEADVELYEWAKKYAQKRRISVAELVRTLLIAERAKDQPPS